MKQAKRNKDLWNEKIVINIIFIVFNVIIIFVCLETIINY